MPKLKAWPARTLSGNRAPIMRYDLKSGETFERGDPVVLDANEEILEVSGTDPVEITGFACGNAADVIEAGKIEVWLATGDVVFAMQGDDAPTADDVNQSYGIVETSGVWLVDGTDTSNTRVYVLDVDIDRELYFVIVLDSARTVNA